MPEELSAETNVEVAETTEVVEEATVETPQEEVVNEQREVVQSKEENAEFARMRREAETNAKLEKAKVDAIIEAVGENPFTGKPIQNKADADEYLLMKRIKKEGKDPISDYYEYVKPASKEQWLESDAQDFKKKYPSVDKAILDSETFAKFAKGKIGVLQMSEIWEDYNSLFPPKKTTEAQALANKKSSPGKLSAPEQTDNLYSKEDLQRLSQKEMLANWEKVQKSAKKYNINI